jgi:aspartyl-tRNA(Asn)/glutamyl-tRNA(Gln) amidotransferase subunit A
MSVTSEFGLVEAAAAIRTRKVSSLELTQSCLARIEKAQPSLNCAITIFAEEALDAARAADAVLAEGRPTGPLHGVPLAHKDMFYRAGRITTCGSKIRSDFVPDYTATVLKKLDAAGALHIAALNMSEFAYSPTGHNVHFGDCHNPWRTEHIAGGSSSGSAAAVAAGLVFGALGSDTAGSVRLPAALCGVTGLKPTFGRVSRRGAMPVSFSLDVVGPLTRTVRDCELLTDIVSGVDVLEPTTLDFEGCATGNEPGASVRGLRLGIPTTYFYESMTAEIDRLFAAVADVFRKIGVEIVEVAPPDLDEMAALANIILGVEAATIHSAWFHQRPQDYSDLVRARIELGFHHPGTRYLEALNLRAHHLDRFGQAVFERADAMLAPLIPIPVPTLEETDIGGPKAITSMVPLLTRCGRPINYLGIPSLAIPAGFSDNGLPFGVQLVARPFDEAMLFRLGHAYERETAWHRCRPPGFHD